MSDDVYRSPADMHMSCSIMHSLLSQAVACGLGMFFTTGVAYYQLQFLCDCPTVAQGLQIN